MQTQKRRRWSDSDNSGAGPGGAPMQPHAAAALSDEDAGAVRDLYLRGGATLFVIANMSMLQVRRLRQAGLIETQQDVNGRDRFKLTPNGLQAVVQGAQSGAGPAR